MDAQELSKLVFEAFREESSELLHALEGALRNLQQDPDQHANSLRDLSRTLHTLKGAANSVALDQLTQRIHDWEEQISALTDQGPISEDCINAFFETLEAIEGLIASESGAPSTPSPEEPEPLQAETLRVAPKRIEQLETIFWDLNRLSLRSRHLLQSMLQSRRQVTHSLRTTRQLNILCRRLKRQLKNEQLNQFEDLLKTLQHQLSEMDSDNHRLARTAPNLQDQESALLSALEDQVRSLRLLPLQGYFQQYDKVVRQAARHCQKKAQLKILAHGAEIDRAVFSQLQDPLLHLVRNAVVHGLETPEQRLKLGKPESGTITLEATCSGGRATLRISDDGAGIDHHRVLQKAHELGLANQQNTLDDQQLLDLLTSPGFSTRSQADELAGRGIGLDVVATRLRKLDGTLSLHSQVGAGTCFSLNVPITTATSPGLIVLVQGQEYGLLFDHIESVTRIQTQLIESLQDRDVIKINEQTIAVIPLASLIGLDPEPLNQAKQPAVILKLGEHKLALLVDDIPGDQTMILKPFPKAFQGLALFMGGCIKDDNQILPVLQVTELFSRAAHQSQYQSLRAQASEYREPVIKSALVVDDSITMRTLERNILQAAGYHVQIAHDGQDALDILSHNQSFDVVVTDLQMPRVDGLELCRRIRASSTPNLPILVVSSVAGPAEQQQALEAGADAYIVKSQFKQHDFLESVERLAG